MAPGCGFPAAGPAVRTCAMRQAGSACAVPSREQVSVPRASPHCPQGLGTVPDRAGCQQDGWVSAWGHPGLLKGLPGSWEVHPKVRLVPMLPLQGRSRGICQACRGPLRAECGFSPAIHLPEHPSFPFPSWGSGSSGVRPGGIASGWDTIWAGQHLGNPWGRVPHLA